MGDPLGCLEGGGEFSASSSCPYGDGAGYRAPKSPLATEPWPTQRHFIPSGWWKLIRDLERNLTHVYLFRNDWNEESCAYQNAGKDGLVIIESRTGFRFPDEWKNRFGEKDSDFTKGTGCRVRRLSSGCKPWTWT